MEQGNRAKVFSEREKREKPVMLYSQFTSKPNFKTLTCPHRRRTIKQTARKPVVFSKTRLESQWFFQRTARYATTFLCATRMRPLFSAPREFFSAQLVCDNFALRNSYATTLLCATRMRPLFSAPRQLFSAPREFFSAPREFFSALGKRRNLASRNTKNVLTRGETGGSNYVAT